MNRKERRRLEKEAQKQGKKTGSHVTPAYQPAAQSAAGHALFNYAMGNTTAQNENLLDHELQQISQQLNAGFTGDALAACQKLNLSYPNHPEIQMLSGMAHFMNQAWKQATQCFETVISQDPNNIQALVHLGNLAIEQDDLDRAETYFRQAVESSPDDQNALQHLAYILQRRESMIEAANIYRKLLKNDPNSAEMKLNFGYALFKSGDSNGAVKEFREVIDLDPELGLAQINLGFALSDLDDDAAAITAFCAGLKSETEHVEGIIGLARCLRAQDENDEAVKYYQRALDLAPDRTTLNWELGYSLELSGDKENGQKAYEKCLEHNPDHSVARHLLDALTGNTTEFAPHDYVEDLFDDYAKSFDDSLVNELNYIVPKLINQRLEKLTLPRPLQSVLDLGGGTGLVAAEMREHIEPNTGIIHGVDLSTGMLEIADQNNRYEQSFTSDIVAFLENKEQGLPLYDLIVAGDVFVYLGNLTQVFQGVRKRLAAAGWFIFTVEQSPKKDYQLLSTGRFAHSKTYLHNLADEFGFSIIDLEEIVPRQDGDQPISGYMVCLKKQ